MSFYQFLLQFAEAHPFLAFIVVCSVYYFVTFPFRLANRWIRHRNIKTAGWPPPYLDADGDIIEPESKS